MNTLIEYRRIAFSTLDHWLEQGWHAVRDQQGRIKTEVINLDLEVCVVYRACEDAETRP